MAVGAGEDGLTAVHLHAHGALQQPGDALHRRHLVDDVRGHLIVMVQLQLIGIVLLKKAFSRSFIKCSGISRFIHL